MEGTATVTGCSQEPTFRPTWKASWTRSPGLSTRTGSEAEANRGFVPIHRRLLLRELEGERHGTIRGVPLDLSVLHLEPRRLLPQLLAPPRLRRRSVQPDPVTRQADACAARDESVLADVQLQLRQPAARLGLLHREKDLLRLVEVDDDGREFRSPSGSRST